DTSEILVAFLLLTRVYSGKLSVNLLIRWFSFQLGMVRQGRHPTCKPKHKYRHWMQVGIQILRKLITYRVRPKKQIQTSRCPTDLFWLKPQ
ncbi:MAG: hypothetical protein ABW105_04355, partial [Candidatus Thiodiazotropha sp. 6PLUC1]